MTSRWWSVGAWSLLSVAGGFTLAAGCGGDEDDSPGGVIYEPDADTSDAPLDHDADTSCSERGATEACQIYQYIDDVKYCYDGLRVCQGDDGWTDCLRAEDATALAATLLGAGGAGNGGASNGGGGASP